MELIQRYCTDEEEKPVNSITHGFSVLDLKALPDTSDLYEDEMREYVAFVRGKKLPKKEIKFKEMLPIKPKKKSRKKKEKKEFRPVSPVPQLFDIIPSTNTIASGRKDIVYDESSILIEPQVSHMVALEGCDKELRKFDYDPLEIVRQSLHFASQFHKRNNISQEQSKWLSEKAYRHSAGGEKRIPVPRNSRVIKSKTTLTGYTELCRLARQRVLQDRKELRQHLEKKKAAVIIIQRTISMYMATKRVLAADREESSFDRAEKEAKARILQNEFRKIRQRTEQFNQMQIQLKATITLQRNFRALFNFRKWSSLYQNNTKQMLQKQIRLQESNEAKHQEWLQRISQRCVVDKLDSLEQNKILKWARACEKLTFESSDSEDELQAPISKSARMISNPAFNKHPASAR